jgi:hypothetical protein
MQGRFFHAAIADFIFAPGKHVLGEQMMPTAQACIIDSFEIAELDDL